MPVALSMCMCVYVCIPYISLYKACFWDSLLLPGESNSHSNYEMCQVQQTVTNLWQAGSTHATRTRLAHCAPSISPSSFASSLLREVETPTTRSSSWALASKSACNSIKMQKDFHASGTSKWSVCSSVSARCQCSLSECVFVCVCVYPVVAARGVSAKINQSAAIYLLLSEVSAAVKQKNCNY